MFTPRMTRGGRGGRPHGKRGRPRKSCRDPEDTGLAIGEWRDHFLMNTFPTRASIDTPEQVEIRKGSPDSRSVGVGDRANTRGTKGNTLMKRRRPWGMGGANIPVYTLRTEDDKVSTVGPPRYKKGGPHTHSKRR